MTVCATVTVPPAKFVLARTLTSEESFRIELEPTVSLGATLSPYIWASSDDAEQIVDRIKADADIVSVETIDQINGGALLQAEWDVDDNELIRALLASNGSCISAVGTGDGWELTLRFPRRSDLAEYYTGCKNDDLNVSVRSIHDSGWVTDRGTESVLTLPQREALLCALEEGYFEVPREITLQRLAEKLDISDTATSQRLRRGTEKLLIEFVNGDRGHD